MKKYIKNKQYLIAIVVVAVALAGYFAFGGLRGDNADKSYSDLNSIAVGEKVFPFEVLVYDGGASNSAFKKTAEITILRDGKTMARSMTEYVNIAGKTASHTFSLPAGDYSVSIKAPGYKEGRLNVVVKAVTDIAYNQRAISLEPESQESQFYLKP